MTIYLASRFSLSRIIGKHEVVVHTEGVVYVKSLLAQGFTSIVGDKFRAKVAELQLGIPVKFSRQDVTLWRGDILVVMYLPKRYPYWKRELGEEDMKIQPTQWYIFEFK